jgi:glycosyltransferase involved in cell wall biosynthesis
MRYPTEVSLTFSGQIEDFCRDINATAYFVATYQRKAYLSDGAFTMEHRPKRVWSGARYHLGEIFYGLGLIRTALRFKADVVLIDSGCAHFFVFAVFRVLGVRVVPILHNTLWPTGFPPRKLIPRLVRQLDSLLFWRCVPTAAIGVSPECERQVDQLRGRRTYSVFQTRAQFYPDHFARIPPPPPHGVRPFQMMFVGRIVRIKGVFDVLEIARRIENTHPGIVRWELCGRGPDFDELRRRHSELMLDGVVNLRGWTSPEDQVALYAKSHACIVPTRSSFTEGMAMTAAESILAGRPVVTNPVVPALEVLRHACVEAKTDDVDSYLKAVLKLATDPELYKRACAACQGYQAQFYDRSLGLNAVLKRALGPYL